MIKKEHINQKEQKLKAYTILEKFKSNLLGIDDKLEDVKKQKEYIEDGFNTLDFIKGYNRKPNVILCFVLPIILLVCTIPSVVGIVLSSCLLGINTFSYIMSYKHFKERKKVINKRQEILETQQKNVEKDKINLEKRKKYVIKSIDYLQDVVHSGSFVVDEKAKQEIDKYDNRLKLLIKSARVDDRFEPEVEDEFVKDFSQEVDNDYKY